MDGTLSIRLRLWNSHGEGGRHDNIPLEDVLWLSHGRPTIATLVFPTRARPFRGTGGAFAFEETQTEGILAVRRSWGVLHTLQQQYHPWAIVTSARRKLAETHYRRRLAAAEKVIVPIDEIRKGKPDPEGFLRAAEQLGVAPEDCIVFEDTRPGIDAGLSAGHAGVGLLTTFQPRVGTSLSSVISVMWRFSAKASF